MLNSMRSQHTNLLKGESQLALLVKHSWGGVGVILITTPVYWSTRLVTPEITGPPLKRISYVDVKNVFFPFKLWNGLISCILWHKMMLCDFKLAVISYCPLAYIELMSPLSQLLKLHVCPIWLMLLLFLVDLFMDWNYSFLVPCWLSLAQHCFAHIHTNTQIMHTSV